MDVATIFMAILLTSIVLLPLVPVRGKGMITVTTIVLLAAVSSITAWTALSGTEVNYVFRGSVITGPIPVRVDALSGFFMLVINFSFITSALYGVYYMKAYRNQHSNLSLHAISFILAYAGLIGICCIQNSLLFLLAWELMALSTFLLVIFEHYKRETLNAGINFLIQSHVCILLLMLGFIWVNMKMNSFDFLAIAAFASKYSKLTGIALFLCFFAGFAIKAGFVPFHTWLPHAHPAAPSHISGLMSGVIIKIGIYGILRMVLLIKTDYLLLGYIILFFSLLSGLYGVMLAIIQHNLKRLLAYHSIENIGIIGIGIGIGCIGMGKGNILLTTLGFSGALLHVFNHSLFKSLLFYGAGNIYQATHTLAIDKLGGLGKQMPHTFILFLVAALAICGLPPFNGFISEFLIYNGMFRSLQGSDMNLFSWIVCGLFGLSMIGGLALLCFTKATGIVFLGRARYAHAQPPAETGAGNLIPMYLIVIFILLVGLFPGLFFKLLANPLILFTSSFHKGLPVDLSGIADTLNLIGISSTAFILLAAIIYYLRKQILRNKPVAVTSTWGCGYEGASAKMQYSASSYIRTYRKLAEPLFSIRKKKKDINEIFPKRGGQETHPYDKIEEWMIDYPIQGLKNIFNRFTFLQNGDLQLYILYGILFISFMLAIPFVLGYLRSLIDFLNRL